MYVCVCVYNHVIYTYICRQKKQMCSPGYYQSIYGLMVTHALGHMICGFNKCIYIFTYI